MTGNIIFYNKNYIFSRQQHAAIVPYAELSTLWCRLYSKISRGSKKEGEQDNWQALCRTKDDAQNQISQSWLKKIGH